MADTTRKIGEIISKALKEGKWLSISYTNQGKETTSFWIAINDIDFNQKKFKVQMFNESKSLNVLNTWISFDGISDAKIIDFSSYDVPDGLINKIETNLSKCAWLSYDRFNHNILNYYNDCFSLDNDPFQKDYAFVTGVDLRTLRSNKECILNEQQIKQLIHDIYYYDINKIGNSFYTLAINCFSIDEGKKKYVVCYYKVTFDPNKKSLVLDKTLRFNKSFLIDGKRHTLSSYINMSTDEFTNTFEKNFSDYQNLIQSNLHPGEVINTRPEMMLIQRDLPVNLAETYSTIQQKYDESCLPIPLKSFFGNITKRNNVRRKEPSLIIYDKRININQVRVLYNALKYPVTYVQGPPGTGKTQTIINVVLSAFYNEKTVLACSSNNKPVDGIVDQLKFQYRNESINFPFLRLGNFDDVKKATRRILELYNYKSSMEPREDLLSKIKVTADGNNSKLLEMLNIQEKRVEIETCLENSAKLINSFKNDDSQIIRSIKTKVVQLEKDINELPTISNEELTSLFTPLKDSHQLSQFLFFKSLLYINKLKKPRYQKLIEVCQIDDDDERAKEFNLWTQSDENMRLLNDAFPVIFSTNISSRRLGSPKYMFDLVIMDEAGQCNVATALLPIAKADSLLLVGDPNQLKPVIVLEDRINDMLKEQYHISEQYDYKHNSILSVMRENDNISKYILLKYHYRCGKKIIDFSNQRYYGNALDLSAIKEDGALEVLDVKNQNVGQRNEAIDEASAIIDYVRRNNLDDVFIITPFVNQKELLQGLLKANNITGVECGTIHSIQGAEKSTIIMSTAISYKTSKRTFEWIKDNFEIINVAVTRAKNKLIIAADTKMLELFSDKNDDLYNLVEYARNNGKISVPPNDSVKIEIGNSNASKAEDEFFATISHFCSCHKAFDAERNVKLSKLFKNNPSQAQSTKEFDLVIFEKTFWKRTPIIAFEVNGGEHLGTLSREQSDREKMRICKENNIKLIFIPNSFMKAYEYIADIIYSSKDPKTSVQQTLFDIDGGL